MVCHNVNQNYIKHEDQKTKKLPVSSLIHPTSGIANGASNTIDQGTSISIAKLKLL